MCTIKVPGFLRAPVCLPQQESAHGFDFQPSRPACRTGCRGLGGTGTERHDCRERDRGGGVGVWRLMCVLHVACVCVVWSIGRFDRETGAARDDGHPRARLQVPDQLFGHDRRPRRAPQRSAHRFQPLSEQQKRTPQHMHLSHRTSPLCRTPRHLSAHRRVLLPLSSHSSF